MSPDEPSVVQMTLDQLYLIGPGQAATARAQARLKQALASHTGAAAQGRPAAEVWYALLAHSSVRRVYGGVRSRVLSADGSLRGYSGGGGIATKERLLRLEGARG